MYGICCQLCLEAGVTPKLSVSNNSKINRNIWRVCRRNLDEIGDTFSKTRISCKEVNIICSSYAIFWRFRFCCWKCPSILVDIVFPMINYDLANSASFVMNQVLSVDTKWSRVAFKSLILSVCLWVLPFPLEDCSEFGNFVITLLCSDYKRANIEFHLRAKKTPQPLNI
jgi:hypothetical protein